MCMQADMLLHHWEYAAGLIDLSVGTYYRFVPSLVTTISVVLGVLHHVSAPMM